MAIENYSSSSQRVVCCRILGLEPSATREEIKSAYKHLALKWHPDRQKTQKDYAKDRFVEIHEAYQTLMNLTPAPPPMSRDASGFTSPPSTPASKPSNFYSQNASGSSSWSSSGSSSNPSTPRTSTDDLPTPKPSTKSSRHARTHSKTSTDGFRRARTRTLSRVKKSDRAQFTRTESSGSHRSHNSSKSHHSSDRHHHSSRSHKSHRSEPSSSDRFRSHSSKDKDKDKDKDKEKSSSSKHSHSHSHSHSERSSDRSDRSDRDDYHRHRSHRHHRSRSRSHSRSRSRSRSRDRAEHSGHSRHSDKGKEREKGKDKAPKVEEPEVKKEKVEKKPTKLHKKFEKESESTPKEKMEKVEEEVDDLPPQTSEPSFRPPVIGIPLRPSHAPDTSSSDWIFPLPLTLEELFSGTNYRFQITRKLRNSPKSDSHPTSTPKSTHAPLDAEVNTSTIHVNVDIPPGGYKNMTQMRFEGLGNQRKSDGTFQDIVFVIQEVLHDRFIRIQDDLVARIELTWDEALQKEDVILVDGLHGEKIEVPIPKVPDDSKETRIPKVGMPIRNAKDEVVSRGDLVIRWEFVFPQKQSSSKWQALKSKFSWQAPKATAS